MEAIEARATLRFFRISPQKTRLVADLIRGRKVEDAMNVLAFTPKKGARVLLKLLKSAVANAEVKNVEDTELLKVSGVWVSQGPALKRYMPRARGRADVIRRPTSHITIVVQEDLEAKKEAAARRAEREAKRAKKRAAKKAAPAKAKADKESKKEAGKPASKAKAKTAGAKAAGATEKKGEAEAKPKAKAKAKATKKKKAE